MTENITASYQNKNKTKKTLTYRPELDGLRGIAVLSVLFYHAGFSLFKGGYVGVDVFFVISGYLMCSIILKEMEDDKFTIRAFYERRARRILPMLIFTIFASYIPAYRLMMHNLQDFTFFTKSAFYSSIAVSNVFYSKTTKGYFDTSTEYLPLVHTWTLGVEEQFYVIIPLIFIVFWRFGKYTVCVIIGIMAICSFYCTFIQINSIQKFYMLHTRFWELAIGSLVVFVPEQKKSEFGSITGLISVITAILAFDDKLPNPSFYTLLPTLGTALVILYSNENKLASVLSEKNLVTIGLVSFSAYLIHQPIFAFYRIQSLRQVYTNDFIVLIAVTFLISYLTWRFLENPFRDKRKVSFKIIMGLFGASVCCLLGFIAVFSEIIISADIIKDSTNKSFNVNISAVIQANPYITAYSGILLPTAVSNRNCHIYHQYKENENTPVFCRIGLDRFDPPTYFLTGDSISLRYTPAFDAIRGSGVFASIGDSCPTTLLRPKSPKMSTKATSGFRCWLFHDHVFNFIKNNATTIRKVFISSEWHSKLDEDSHLDVAYAILKYAAINVSVYLIEQPPKQPLDTIRVVANLKRQGNLNEISIRNHSLSVKELLDYDRKKYQPFLKQIQKNAPLVHIYTRHIFCDSQCCPIGTVNLTYYADTVHIVAPRSLALKQLFSLVFLINDM